MRAGRPAATPLDERYVFVSDPAAAPDSLVVIRDTTDSIPENKFGSTTDAARTMRLGWSDVRAAYQPILVELLESPTLSDSLFGRDATICLGALALHGRFGRDPAAVDMLRRRGRDVVPIEDCRPSSGITRPGAPPAFQPPPGAAAPVYIEPELESWTDDTVWIRASLVQHHGVDVRLCEVRRTAAAWRASCKQIGAFVF
jgi:hypothetical protein